MALHHCHLLSQPTDVSCNAQHSSLNHRGSVSGCACRSESNLMVGLRRALHHLYSSRECVHTPTRANTGNNKRVHFYEILDTLRDADFAFQDLEHVFSSCFQGEKKSSQSCDSLMVYLDLSAKTLLSLVHSLKQEISYQQTDDCSGLNHTINLLKTFETKLHDLLERVKQVKGNTDQTQISFEHSVSNSEENVSCRNNRPHKTRTPKNKSNGKTNNIRNLSTQKASSKTETVIGGHEVLIGNSKNNMNSTNLLSNKNICCMRTCNAKSNKHNVLLNENKLQPCTKQDLNKTNYKRCTNTDKNFCSNPQSLHNVVHKGDCIHCKNIRNTCTDIKSSIHVHDDHGTQLYNNHRRNCSTSSIHKEQHNTNKYKTSGCTIKARAGLSQSRTQVGHDEKRNDIKELENKLKSVIKANRDTRIHGFAHPSTISNSKLKNQANIESSKHHKDEFSLNHPRRMRTGWSPDRTRHRRQRSSFRPRSNSRQRMKTKSRERNPKQKPKNVYYGGIFLKSPKSEEKVRIKNDKYKNGHPNKRIPFSVDSSKRKKSSYNYKRNRNSRTRTPSHNPSTQKLKYNRKMIPIGVYSSHNYNTYRRPRTRKRNRNSSNQNLKYDGKIIPIRVSSSSNYKYRKPRTRTPSHNNSPNEKLRYNPKTIPIRFSYTSNKRSRSKGLNKSTGYKTEYSSYPKTKSNNRKNKFNKNYYYEEIRPHTHSSPLTCHDPDYPDICGTNLNNNEASYQYNPDLDYDDNCETPNSFDCDNFSPSEIHQEKHKTYLPDNGYKYSQHSMNECTELPYVYEKEDNSVYVHIRKKISETDLEYYVLVTDDDSSVSDESTPSSDEEGQRRTFSQEQYSDFYEIEHSKRKNEINVFKKVSKNQQRSRSYIRLTKFIKVSQERLLEYEPPETESSDSANPTETYSKETSTDDIQPFPRKILKTKHRSRSYIRIAKFIKVSQERLVEYELPETESSDSTSPTETYSKESSADNVRTFTRKTSTTELIKIIKAVGTNTQNIGTREKGVDPIPKSKNIPPTIEKKSKFTNTDKLKINDVGVDAMPLVLKPKITDSSTDPLYYLIQKNRSTNTSPDTRVSIRNTVTDTYPTKEVQKVNAATDPLKLERSVKYTNTEVISTKDGQTETDILPKPLSVVQKGTDPNRLEVKHQMTSYEKVTTTERGTDAILQNLVDKSQQISISSKKGPKDPLYLETSTKQTNTEGISTRDGQSETDILPKPLTVHKGTDPERQGVKHQMTSYEKVTTTERGTDAILQNLVNKGQQFDTIEKRPSVMHAQTSMEPIQGTGKAVQTSFESTGKRPSMYEKDVQTLKMDTQTQGIDPIKQPVFEQEVQTSIKEMVTRGVNPDKLIGFEKEVQTDKIKAISRGIDPEKVLNLEKTVQTDKKAYASTGVGPNKSQQQEKVVQTLGYKSFSNKSHPENESTSSVQSCHESETAPETEPAAFESELSMHLVFEKCHEDVYKVFEKPGKPVRAINYSTNDMYKPKPGSRRKNNNIRICSNNISEKDSKAKKVCDVAFKRTYTSTPIHNMKSDGKENNPNRKPKSEDKFKTIELHLTNNCDYSNKLNCGDKHNKSKENLVRSGPKGCNKDSSSSQKKYWQYIANEVKDDI